MAELGVEVEDDLGEFLAQKGIFFDDDSHLFEAESFPFPHPLSAKRYTKRYSSDLVVFYRSIKQDSL